MKSNKLLPISFKDQTIFFFEIDGAYWLPIRPICNALGLDADWHIRATKKDRLFGQGVCVHTTLGADKRQRKMVCLPEKLIYGWLCSIKITNTMKPETIVMITEYQLECYDVLHAYFNGVIIKRQSVLLQQDELTEEINSIEEKLKANEDYQKLVELTSKKKAMNKSLKEMDVALITRQLRLFTK